ncbi:MAG TPA: tetratricopeptide repeat protein, partial [Candidatus Acidoferrales bacterium]|nr:tetratricopeptide repeat protein [Candidatus Acidoferrales bacterium]
DLAQSPFLNFLPDARIRATLPMMGHTATERLTPDLARQVCQRASGKAVLSGSITLIGSQYVIGLDAANCATGDSIAKEQVTAASKEKVLGALDSAATKLRGELGESLASVQKYDTRLEDVTTPSLEALKAYTLGMQKHTQNDETGALPYFKHAVELDPNFAMAYARLGVAASNLSEYDIARQAAKQAFDLRDRTSERERIYIQARYYDSVTGDLNKVIDTYQLSIQTYPREDSAYNNLGGVYLALGQREKAVSLYQQTIQIAPDSAHAYSNLARAYLDSDRLAEAKAVCAQALARFPEDPSIHKDLMEVAFLEGDADGMKKRVDWAIGKPSESEALSFESSVQAHYGHLAKSQELNHRSIEAARRDGFPTAESLMFFADLEAFLGEPAAARQDATEALSESQGRVVQYGAMTVFAKLGDAARAESFAEASAKDMPEATILNQLWIPNVRATIELGRGAPEKAIAALEPTTPYEFSTYGGMLSHYLRGQAYLMEKKGADAAGEFQKVLDHPGLVGTDAVGPMARLGLARAYVVSAASSTGDQAQAFKSKARAAYQDFLALWKDADPDLPALKQAKAEYAKLQ